MSPPNIQAKPLHSTELDHPHHSDGHELIPAEIPLMELSDTARQSSEYVPMPGATQDDEGLLNNFAVEPVIYSSEYPSPQQQKRYILMGVGATLFVVTLTLIAFFVS
jgi:hypothetical protein